MDSTVGPDCRAASRGKGELVLEEAWIKLQAHEIRTTTPQEMKSKGCYLMGCDYK